MNAIFDRIAQTSFFSSFVCKRINRALPIESGGPVQIPFLGVYLLEENMAPDGDPNAGDIRLDHAVPIGFQIIMKNNNSDILLQMMDQATWFIMNQLFRDNTFTNRCVTNMPDNTTFEGVIRGRVRERWGVTGATQEMPVVERLLELVFRFRTSWCPTEFPDLERITVTTAFPPGDAQGQSETHQVKVVYEFAPDSVPTPLPPDP